MEKVKNEMAALCDEFHWAVENLESELRKKIEELKEKNLDNEHFSRDNRANWFKSIVHYMVNGLTYKQAIQLLADEYNYDALKMRKVFEAFNYERRAIDTYAKIYTIRTLKKAGFTNAKIADIMEISTATVARLLRCKVKI